MPPLDVPPILEQPVLRLLASLDTDAPRRLIALAGLPGAGKSTLAARLAAEVNARSGPNAMAALGMDGFHLSQAELKRLPNPHEAFARRGAPWTFDRPALAERLRRLRAGAGRESVPWPDFQHDIGDPVEDAHTIAPDVRLVLVEGLYLLSRDDGWDAVGEIFDERWYLDTPLAVAMERLVRRHESAWGMSRHQAEARVASNDRLNAETVLAARFNADWHLAP